jgi:hypothetical protein
VLSSRGSQRVLSTGAGQRSDRLDRRGLPFEGRKALPSSGQQGVPPSDGQQRLLSPSDGRRWLPLAGRPRMLSTFGSQRVDRVLIGGDGLTMLIGSDGLC